MIPGIRRNFRRAPVPTDPVSAVYCSPPKIGKLNK
jgi:hypothetical protein